MPLCVSISGWFDFFSLRREFAVLFEPAQFCLITFVHDANGPRAHACFYVRVCVSVHPGERC